MNTGQVIRDAAARHSALLRYAAAYDRFAELEQRARGRRRLAEAADFHDFVLWAYRAYDAELRDPQPPGLPR